MVIDDGSTRVTPSQQDRPGGACVTRYRVNMGYGRELVKARECTEIDGSRRPSARRAGLEPIGYSLASSEALTDEQEPIP